MKILIVDDNKEMRATIAQNVKSEADQIFECDDGDEAIKYYEKHLPDWVLMDIKMKRVSGLTATHEIKKHYPEAKIIIVTNHGGDVFRKAAVNAGADGFFSKKNLGRINEQLHHRIEK